MDFDGTPTGRVTVVGSLNMDLSLYCPRLPRAGETVLASMLKRSPGGKGANQAVAAARAGGVRTTMVGAVGDDADGRALRASLDRAGVSTAGLATVVGEPTGLALITVDGAGENSIVVVSGANGGLAVDDAMRADIASADVVLAQLETPQQVVAEAARARRSGATFILNAAPATRLAPELLHEVDLLVVNEGEACAVADRPDLAAATADLLRQLPAVLVTLGSAGSMLRRRASADVRVAAARVEARDTTAAGDTFCGVLAAGLAAGQPIEEAMLLATAAASITVERPGAQESIPTLTQTHDRVATMRHAGDAGQ